MIKRLSFVIFFLFGCISNAQNETTITIINGETNQPISNVNIKIKGTEKGFVTNHEGVFIIDANDNLKAKDILMISHIQYFKEELSVGSIKAHNNTIRLLSTQYLLNEIVLNSKKKKKNNQLITHTKVTTIPKGLSNFDAYIKDGNLTILGGMELSEIDNWDKITDKDQWIETGGPDFEQILTTTIFYNNYKSYNSNVYRFDLEKNNWATDKKKTIERAFHNVHLTNDKVYIIGGKRLSKGDNKEYLENRIEVIDLDDNSVEIDQVNPHKAVNFASFLHDNKLILMGGSVKQKENGDKEFNNKVHFQNLETGLWYQLGNMPIAKETQGVIIDEQIYLIGGNNNNPVKNIESFNLKTGKWKKEGELFKAIEQPGLAAVDSMVYIFDQGDILTYNIETKRLNRYKTNLSLSSPKVLLDNDKLYIIGGSITASYKKFSSNAIFSIDLNQFKPSKIVDSKLL